MTKAYKIRNKKTGKFWAGRTHGNYTDNGKSWSTIAGLKIALSMLDFHLSFNHVPKSTWISDHELVELTEVQSSIKLAELT